MRKMGLCAVVLMASATGVAAVALVACGGSNSGGGFGDDAGGSPGNPNNPGNPDATSPSFDGGGVAPPLQQPDGAASTPPVTYTDGGCAGLQCAITSCSNDGGTTISGRIVDPAGANPLYNILAYVPMYDPAQPSTIPAGQGVQPITGGVKFPSGVTCDDCSYLYTGNPIAVGSSGTDGKFTITNAPSGKNIPVVVQVGKWRTHTTVSTVTDCTDNAAGDIKLPGKADGTDPIVSMPQIAISMGGADTMECLPYRMGIDLSEFTSGPSTKGHIHVFTGGGFGGGLPGSPPDGSQQLWDSLADLNKYDVTLFSCEGSETANANPQLLEQYVNAGGRAFTSHYHYAWLAGPLQGGATYTANPDWGNNLASWNNNDPGADTNTLGGEISTTLNVGGGPFPKGQALQDWLQNVGALGTSSVKANEVAITGPSYDPNVTSANTVSQPWVTYDTTSSVDNGYPTAYFSFNTPVNAVAPPDGGAPPYCGRVVFSGLHVGAAANDTTGGSSMPSATSCSPSPGQLSPQEKVLEFMLFDIASCVQPTVQ